MNDNLSNLKEFNNLDVAAYAERHPALFAYVKEAMAQPGKQFLLVGDTKHKDTALETFLHSPALAALFNYASIPHVAWELMRENTTQEKLDAFREKCGLHRQGLLNDDELVAASDDFFADAPETKRAFLHKNLSGFMRAGLRTTPADSVQWRDGTPNNAERVFLGDREVASYISRIAAGDKTAVVYGAAHFYYNDSMGTRFGRDKCVHVDIYSSRKIYDEIKNSGKLYVDFMPNKVYFLQERELAKPDTAVYFAAREKENDEAQGWRDEVAYLYGPNPPMMAQLTAMTEHLHPLPGTDPQWFTYVPEAV